MAWLMEAQRGACSDWGTCKARREKAAVPLRALAACILVGVDDGKLVA